MAQRKVNKTEGHYLAGDAVTFDDELNFVVTTNPEIDSQGGGFLWKTITNIVNSWRLRDDVKNGGQDIIVIDTVNDIVELKSPYTAIGFGVLSFNVDLDSAESTVARAFAGGRTTFTVTHSLGTLDIKPEVFRLSDGRTIGWRIERTGINTIEASRNGNVADGLFRLII